MQAPSPTLLSTDIESKSLTERLLSSRLAPYIIAAVFVLILLAWSKLDFSVPEHDAVCHSNYSSLVEKWLCRPRGWSIESLRSILTLMPNYPAGSWFFNAICKMFVGESRFSEQIVLAIHLLLLNFATYVCSWLLLKDKLKASLAQFLMNCCPIILMTQHLPLIDLLHTAVLMLFYCSLIWWWQQQTWRRAGMLALIFGFCCLSKQIAILYTAPALVVVGIVCLYKRRIASVAQLAMVAATAAVLLMTWVLPNWSYLLEYSHQRSAFASTHQGVFASILDNFKMSFVRTLEGLSWPTSLLLICAAPKFAGTDLKSLSPLLLATFVGAFLMSIVAYYNTPEARYYAPAVVSLSILLGACAANILRSTRWGEITVSLCTALIFAQALLLSFQALPASFTTSDLLNSPVNLISGVREPYVLEHLGYVPAGDPWKQEWMYDFIENAEQGKSVYVNILSNSNAFNLGTLAFVGKLRKSKLQITTWRGIGADISDTFHYSDDSLRCMQWVVEKTGDEKKKFFDHDSESNYSGLLEKLRHGGKYIEAARQRLPDGTELILYRNKDWFVQPAIPAKAKN